MHSTKINNLNFGTVSSRVSYGNITNNGIGAFNSDLDTPAFDLYQEDKMRARQPTTNDNISTALRGYNLLKGIDPCKEYDDDDNGVAKIFFSPDNIKRIQKMLKQEIYVRTNKQFKLEEDQNEADLLVCMRAVYLQYARFLPFKLIKQVKILNRNTVQYIVPDMITQIKQSYAYIKEINEPIKPIMRPLNVSHAGRKSLPALTTVYGF